MKTRDFIVTIAVAIVTVMTIPTGFVAQDATAPANKTQHHHYELIGRNPWWCQQLRQFPNRPSRSPGHGLGESQTAVPLPMNFNVAGCSGPNVAHAFECKGVLTDLNALDPSKENCGIVSNINARGEIAGFSENGELDPQTGMTEFPGSTCGQLDDSHQSSAGRAVGDVATDRRDPLRRSAQKPSWI